MATSTDRADARVEERPVAVTIIGLLLALGGPPLYALVAGPALFGEGTTPLATGVGLAVMWALCIAVLALVRLGERRPWASLGMRSPGLKWLALAVVLGIALSLLVPLLAAVASAVLPRQGEGTVGSVATGHHWLVLLIAVLTAAVTEEVLFRGYAIERLLELSGSRWVAGGVSLAAFTLTHAAGWSLAHVVGVVIPLGAALTLLYLWRRNLVVVVVAHFLVDLPLVVISAMTA
ncbi:CPBP family intramembrane glutamic endopeptidase [Naasia sp. SYSU D00948]|uniref:CPBP family intramembrane glutamic endopeptidase n=1 Tax=Naasia sp. SYSU D00948 TaxID=2817379 RepID=UPI001B314B33|nr:type II CAAX endopeptidase family protein [Naasia sp. SYSU D00948]